MHSDIEAAELVNRLNEGQAINLLDVREEIEYCTYNIGGINMPADKLSGYCENRGINKNEEIIVICSAGLRSKTAADLLTAQGFTNVRNLTGGLLALRKAGL
jgi:rhodanese-related sulfurtransferase